ncbi:unnamed protein product [Symbiodinium necroappetens]|uniref:Uncharacterized protein n=1 Tax=Symbiodinium necroappetens TaxID=1628268 RepID=A0A812YMH3_9DINO|nr:unnamed protein product [Symbiodinium necroappetens]
MSYREVALNHPSYVRWALSQPSPTGGLRSFVAWLRAHPPDAARDEVSSVNYASSASEDSELGSEPDIDSEAASDEPSMHAQALPLHLPMVQLMEQMVQHSGRLRDLSRLMRQSVERRGDVAFSHSLSALLGELPRVTYSASLFSGAPHPQSCPICMEDFDAWEAGHDSEIVMTPCLHTFHLGCLRGWLKRSPECPTCRWDITDLGADKALDSSCVDLPQTRPDVPRDLEIVVPGSLPAIYVFDEPAQPSVLAAQLPTSCLFGIAGLLALGHGCSPSSETPSGVMLKSINAASAGSVLQGIRMGFTLSQKETQASKQGYLPGQCVHGASVEEELASGKRLLEEYSVGEAIGEGAFGVVYACAHRKTSMQAAVKMVDKVETPTAVIRREAELMKSLSHDNIVRFHAVYFERLIRQTGVMALAVEVMDVLEEVRLKARAKLAALFAQSVAEGHFVLDY